MKAHTHLTTLPSGALPGIERPENLNPAITNFLAAREQLQQRAQELAAEMSDIQQLLNGQSPEVLPVKSAPPPPPPNEPPRRSNSGLCQAVTELMLQHGALTKDQIVAHLLAKKFEFFGKPKPALDPVLYSKKFRRDGKLFGLAVAS